MGEYSSVQAPGVPAPNARPAFWVPAPAKIVLAAINAPPAAQVDPSYSSVQEKQLQEGACPPKARPAFCVPAPAR